MQVLLYEVHDPVHKEYHRLSSVFNKVLSWLPWEQRQCNLKEMIDREEYPPCIHSDLRYNDPSMKQDVHSSLNISMCRSSTDFMSFTVKIPSEHLNEHWV